jgi:hypothetical protein
LAKGPGSFPGLLMRLRLPLMLLTCRSATAGQPQEASPGQEKAIAAIEALGGEVAVDEAGPDGPVVEVNLGLKAVKDAGLIHLKGLVQLQALYVQRTRVGNAGSHVRQRTPHHRGGGRGAVPRPAGGQAEAGSDRSPSGSGPAAGHA